MFIVRVIGIVKIDIQQIIKHRFCFLKRNAVFLQVHGDPIQNSSRYYNRSSSSFHIIEGWTYFLPLISGFFSGASHCTPPEWEIVISICPDTG
jgi:hypothetical protein